jgi:predicted DNA-binding protein YlxM (UPF0122 family)
MKLTVNEYAKEFKTSVQSVYQRIKRGSLKSVESNGIKYVVIEDTSIKSTLNENVESEFKDMFKIIKRLQKQLTKKDKEIKRLVKALEKANKSKEEVFLNYITELKQLQITYQEPEEIILEEKKKKKFKKKKKKH